MFTSLYPMQHRVRKNTQRLDDAYVTGERCALQNLSYKYLWFSDGPDEFYDVAADPYETHDLIDEPNPTKLEMKRTIEQIVAAFDSDEEAAIVDEATLEQLRSLGYVR